jgi:transcriptional regulator NrdR family protein
MKCPFCSHLETQVVETRVSEDGVFIRRRRQCGACDKRFTTYERPVLFYFGWRTTFPTESMVRPLLLAEDCPAGG